MEFSYPFRQPVHPLAIEVCHTLRQAGFEAYIVGGCVRDLHLGLTPKDWDITTSASPEEVIKLFPRTIPTGLQHGTVTVCMTEGVENHFEVTTFRVEGEYLDGRRPESVQFVKNLTEDLARRDFTINAMAFDPINNISMDPFDGRVDLCKKVIRAVGNANTRFQEDGLRIMRAARFAARFGYEIEENTLIGMKSNLETLKKVSKERVNDELCKILTSKHRSHGMMLLVEVSAIGIACPLLHDISATRLKKLDDCEGELETRLALLYHRFPVKLVQEELATLKFSNKEIKKVAFLLLTRASFLGFQQSKSVVAYRHFIARLKNDMPDTWMETKQQFIEFARCLDLPARELLWPYAYVSVPARSDLAINGLDLLDLGIEAGPKLKMLLDSAYNEILEHPEHNYKEYLLDQIKKGA